MKDKILVIGAGENQLPYIDNFLMKGYDIVAIDRDPNSPGFKNAEICIPISTHDNHLVIKAISELPEKNEITAVACPSTGIPYITAARCASMLKLHFPSENTVTTLLDKYRFWKVLSKYRLTNRQCFELRNPEYINDQIDLPVVFKPQFAGGGNRGVSICRFKNQLPLAFKKAVMNSYNKSALVESFCISFFKAAKPSANCPALINAPAFSSDINETMESGQ